MISSDHNASKPQLPPLPELLPLGYLYLLLLGIASQSIRYGMLDINYLDYSDLLDVLISPVALVTGNPLLLIALLSVSVLLLPYLWFVRWLSRRRQQVKREGGLLERPLIQIWLMACALALLCGFLGHGAGSGRSTAERLSEGRINLDYRLTFSDGQSVDVDLIGKNSGFVFYVLEGQRHVTVSPITANIRSIGRASSQAEPAARVETPEDP